MHDYNSLLENELFSNLPSKLYTLCNPTGDEHKRVTKEGGGGGGGGERGGRGRGGRGRGMYN